MERLLHIIPYKCASIGKKLLVKTLLLLFCSVYFLQAHSQVGISSTSIIPDASSILELRSTTSGFLPPRMTTAQRDAISSPASGLLIYNSSTNQLNYYTGSAWTIVSGGGQAQLNGTGFVKASGTTISYDNSTYLTGNQLISWTASGDVSGSASGATSISPSLTITGLRGSALPTLSSGFLKYNGSSWAFDNSSYITNANVTFNNQSNTYTAGMKQIFAANATNADIRLTGSTADPSTLSAGDIWYNTTNNIFKGRFNTTTRQLATLDGTEAFSNKNFTGTGNTWPTFNQNTTGTAANVTGVVAVSNGGTGQSSALTAGGVMYGASASAQSVTSAGITGQILKSNGSGAPTWTEGGTMMFTGLSNNATVNNKTLYFPLMGALTGGTADVSAGTRTLVSRAGNLKNLTVLLSAALLSGKTGTVTVFKNGVATSLSVTLTVGPLLFTDNTDSFTVAQGDELSVEVSTTGVAKFSWAVDFVY